MRVGSYKVDLLRAAASEQGLKLPRISVPSAVLCRRRVWALYELIEAGDVEVVCVATQMGRRTLASVRPPSKLAALDRPKRPRIDLSKLPEQLPSAPGPFAQCAGVDAGALSEASQRAQALHDEAMSMKDPHG